jgi:hypothetical protein
MRKLYTSVLFFIFSSSLLLSQQAGTIKGIVQDEQGEPLTGAHILNLNTGKGTVSDLNGHFQLTLAGSDTILLEVSYIGYRKDSIAILPGKEQNEISVHLKLFTENIHEVVISSIYDKAEALQQINIKSFGHIPLPSGNIEALLTIMGASNRNEMSAQYSVRGGNFDENLIYINGIEVYRPLLVKAGQQEGMSIVNAEMVSSVQFAAGGFDARYGDKMSSVLDIRYKRPEEYSGSLSASLLGASAHFEGSLLKHKITHITGIRYKSNQYLLNNLQVKGDYDPHFLDMQTFITCDFSPRLEVSFLGNMAVNTYHVVPQSRETKFGTYQQPMNFTVYYEGQEKDRFSTLLGAISLDYRPTDKLSLKLTGSAFEASESITYDIWGTYRIDLLDNTSGSSTAGDSILNIGYGSSLKHARNYLYADIVDISHKGTYQWNNHQFSWGIGLQSQKFNDKIREWELIDSAGYSIPYADHELLLQNVIISRNKIQVYKLSGYINDIKRFHTGNAEIMVNAGTRFIWMNSNEQFVTSPRLSVYLFPDWKRKFSFHSAIGWYHQPPFYKEMRDPEGNLYTHIKAQCSIHFLLGTSYDFSMWTRPFRFNAEAYYKKLDHLIPYVVDDVKIQYLPQYSAKGYAAGIEFKINGEFVKDAESWASLAFLQTFENRENDAYGSYPRATNQLVSFGLYFQDYFPDNPSIRVHLHMYYGSRLPYNSTEYNNPQKYYYLPSYRRIDIGISKSLMTNQYGEKKPGRIVHDFWISAEVFNLFGFNNMASYQWIRTVNNQEGYPNMFAVPNYLTGRLLNIKMSVEF